MIPVIVLSLSDCHGRRSRISKILNELNIEFEFFEGIDGRVSLPTEWESQIDRVNTERMLSDAEYACALSHINIYRHIVEMGYEYVLMLADDHTPQADLVHYLNAEYYKDAELTQLRCSRAYVSRKDIRNLWGCYKSYLRIPNMNVTGSCAVVISKKAASHFVSNALPINKEADWPECIEDMVAEKKCRVVHPPLVHHSDDLDGGSQKSKAGKRGASIEQAEISGSVYTTFLQDDTLL